jgi:hypothetical protein
LGSFILTAESEGLGGRQEIGWSSQGVVASL